MTFYNLKHPEQEVSFSQAVRQGLGKDQGLFFPKEIPNFSSSIDELLSLPLVERSAKILYPLVQESLSEEDFLDIVTQAFNFPAHIQSIDEQNASLELFHGPTLAFKDFGARFMAQCLQKFTKEEQQQITILTATSGDTGAAVAHAFSGLDNIKVVILFPKGKISLLQEKMFTTLGGNISTLAVNGSFDDCQGLVKTSFDDLSLAQSIGLNSANSINISRLLAQICYYFEAAAQLYRQRGNLDELVFSIPSGNFGNLTAGLLAKAMGLPIKRFIAATNLNDTVPRYLKTGKWDPKDTVATMSNAMDVSKPNNWPRVEHMLRSGIVDEACLSSAMIDEQETQLAMHKLNNKGYISEPHASVAYKALQYSLSATEFGVFLGTAHPAKFKDTVESTLGCLLGLPKELADCASETSLSEDINVDFDQLKQYLLANCQ